MENFFHNDSFYRDLDELIDYVGLDLEPGQELKDLPDDFTITVELSNKKKIVVFSEDWIVERISEDAFSEDGCESEEAQIKKALHECIDFEKLNSMIPSLHYGTGKEVTLTKQDLIEYNEN